LLFAAEYGMIAVIHSYLKDQPNLIDTVNRQRSTAVHLAIRQGKDKVLSWLFFWAGFPVVALAPDCQGLTPLHYALTGKSHRVFVQFLKELDQSAVLDRALQAVRPDLEKCVAEGKSSSDNGWGRAGFHGALEEGNEPLVKAFLVGGINADEFYEHNFKQSHPPLTPLQTATLRQNQPIVQLLLNAGVNPNSKTTNGNTALHYAMYYTSTAIVEALLAAQADPNIQNENGETPVHLAVYSTVAMLEILLRCNVNVDVQDKHGLTALHRAVMIRNPDSQILESLVTANASMFIQDTSGQTPFDFAEGRYCTETFFADRLLSPSFDSRNNELVVNSRLKIKSPLTLTDNHGLCDVLVKSVDDFYSLLNNFENPGFALGFDILREGVVLAEPLDMQFFTGIYQVRSKLMSF